MPISFQTLPRTDIPFVRCDGVVSLVDLMSGLSYYAGSPISNAKRILIDVQPIETLDLTAREFLNFIPLMRSAVARRKTPVDFYIAVRAPSIRAFVALYDRFAGPTPLIRLRPYGSLPAALKAMDLPVAKLAQDVA